MLNVIQQGMKRRQIRKFLDDPGLIQELAAPLDRQTNILMNQATEAQLTPALATGDYTALTAMLSENLVNNESLPAATVGTGPFATLLAQLMAILMPMLTACIPAAKPTPAQVLAMVQ